MLAWVYWLVSAMVTFLSLDNVLQRVCQVLQAALTHPARFGGCLVLHTCVPGCVEATAVYMPSSSLTTIASQQSSKSVASHACKDALIASCRTDRCLSSTDDRLASIDSCVNRCSCTYKCIIHAARCRWGC